AMMAITTSSSISVNADRRFKRVTINLLCEVMRESRSGRSRGGEAADDTNESHRKVGAGARRGISLVRPKLSRRRCSPSELGRSGLIVGRTGLVAGRKAGTKRRPAVVAERPRATDTAAGGANRGRLVVNWTWTVVPLRS